VLADGSGHIALSLFALYERSIVRILLIYHFFHPDSVVSARIYTDLALALVADGHEVTVFSSNRFHRGKVRIGTYENWRGIYVYRFSRPRFDQSKNIQRLLNSLVVGNGEKWRDFDGLEWRTRHPGRKWPPPISLGLQGA